MTRRLALPASAFALGLAVSLQPLSLDMTSLKLEKSQAQAKGGDGGGNGGGNGDGNGGGGGNGGGNSGSHGGGGNSGGGGNGGGNEGGSGGDSRGGGSERSGRSSGARDASTKGQERGHDRGQARAEQARSATRDVKDAGAKVSSDAKRAAASAKTIGLDTAKLGRMNAVNASATARQHAAAHSTVGLIATYEKALSVSKDTEDQITDAEITAAATALAALSKAGVPEEPVALLNEKLGLEIAPEVLDQVIDEARDIQAARQ